MGLDAQVLHDEVPIAFEARALGNRHRRRDLERLVNPQVLRLAALGRPGALARLTLAPFIIPAVALITPIDLAAALGLPVHSARFELRLRLLSLEYGDLIAQLLNPFRLPAVLLEQFFDLLQQLLHQRRALRFGNARQLLAIGHGQIWTVGNGDIWEVTLTHLHSSLI